MKKQRTIPVIATPIAYRAKRKIINGNEEFYSQSARLFNVTSMDGSIIYKDLTVATRWVDKFNSKHVMQFKRTTDSFIEVPMTSISDNMQYDTYVGKGYSAIKHRLVDNKEQQFLQLTHRFICYIPSFMYKSLVNKFPNMVKQPKPDLFSNQPEFWGIAESTARNSFNQEYLEDRADVTYREYDHSQSLKQWELDNPEYMSFSM